MATIASLEELRLRYPAPVERSVVKVVSELDAHSMQFIRLSPFVVITSVDRSGNTDSSPRGGEPGFVRILDATHVLIPDSAGNNRLDTFTNIVDTARVSLLFLIPGINETLRINGSARLTDDEALMERFADERHAPRMIVEVTLEEAYFQCPKAFMRAKLWDPDSRIARTTFPSLAQMIKEQAGLDGEVETQTEAEERYRRVLEEDG